MKAAELLAMYERVADAPDAVEKLRRLVLDLAVRGRLVEHGLGTSTLSSGSLNSRTRTPSAGEFPIPDCWTWTTVGEVAESRLGKMLDKSKNKGTPRRYLRNVNVRWFDFDLSDLAEMRFEDAELSEFELRVGDVLICEGGEPGRAAVWDGRAQGLYFQKAIHRVRFANSVLSSFFVLSLRASASDGRLASYFTGTGIKHLTGKGLSSYRFALPPLAEQHRIVAKVDELMALCDQLETARKDREAARDRLASASLARLNVPDPDTFQSDVRFALDVLPALSARPDQVKQLRQTILNLAVRGKLVKQDPADEPASELLRRVSSARRLSTAEQNQRIEGEMGAMRPRGWEQVVLSQVCDFVTSGSRGWAEYYATTGAWFIRAQNIRFGTLLLDNLACVRPPKSAEGSRTQVQRGDLLIVITGAGVTNPALLDQDLGEAYISQHVALVRPNDRQLSRWLLLCMMADEGGRAELVRCAYGSGKPGLNLDNIRTLRSPLPPLAEQDRIVAKVDELMALCDQLEESLNGASTARSCLLNALLHEAIASTGTAA